jgi:hypothetical protein
MDKSPGGIGMKAGKTPGGTKLKPGIQAAPAAANGLIVGAGLVGMGLLLLLLVVPSINRSSRCAAISWKAARPRAFRRGWRDPERRWRATDGRRMRSSGDSEACGRATTWWRWQLTSSAIRRSPSPSKAAGRHGAAIGSVNLRGEGTRRWRPPAAGAHQCLHYQASASRKAVAHAGALDGDRVTGRRQDAGRLIQVLSYTAASRKGCRRVQRGSFVMTLVSLVFMGFGVLGSCWACSRPDGQVLRSAPTA